MPSLLTNLAHKQLFLTDCEIKGTEILITNQDLLNQVRKVLRLQKGDTIYVQKEWMRYEVEIKDRTDKTLMGIILGTTQQIPLPSASPFHKGAQMKMWMIIGMPNKREKVELIVQKLTEIWLDEIIFRPSERSIIKTWNENKSERLQKIAREAVEQSWWRTMPNIEFVTDIKEKLQNSRIIVFDKAVSRSKEQGAKNLQPVTWNLQPIFGLVGPEWGLTERDYEALKWVKYEVRELGATMLRTETAAIVGWWIVRNEKF